MAAVMWGWTQGLVATCEESVSQAVLSETLNPEGGHGGGVPGMECRMGAVDALP